jgi:hypothetical protein
VQKETSSNITLKVNLTVTLDVNFILMFKFNFILTCYFDILKARLGSTKKQNSLLIVSLKCKLIYIETIYK